MQLGTRWNTYTAPPVELPDAVLEALAGVESELHSLSVDATTWRWTLTYLEGRPVIQLDDGTTVRQLADGSVSVEIEE